MSNESVVVHQSINEVTVTATGSVGLNAGGLIQGNLEVDGTVIIGADTDGKDVRFWGETASKYTLWDASQDTLIITGDLQVDGTTTTINSTVVTIEDPVFTLGGESPPVGSDSKDRGIEFHYYDTDASAGKKGFFGWGNSENAIKFLLNCADPSGSEIFTGDLAEVHTGKLVAGGGVSDTYAELGPYWDFTGDRMSSSGALKINAGSGEDLHLQENGTDRLVVKRTTGNVGIGTDSPSEKLEIDGGDLKVTAGDVWVADSSKKVTVGSTNYKHGAIEGNGNDIRIAPGGTKSLILHGGDELGIQILDGGNVGIGTASPAYPLDVVGNVMLRPGTGELLIQQDSTYINVRSTGTNGGFKFSDVGNKDEYIIDRLGNYHAWKNNMAETMRLTTTGLGIGTASPAYKLDCRTTGDDDLVYFAQNGTSNPRFKIDSSGSTTITSHTTINGAKNLYIESGKLGIGTASPSALLEIYDGSSTDGLIVSGTEGREITMLTNAGAGGPGIVVDASHNLDLSPGGGDILMNRVQGNVGIGTASAARKLHVDAGSLDVGIRLESSDELAKIELKDNGGTAWIGGKSGELHLQGGGSDTVGSLVVKDGNVGIGTASPDSNSKLDVIGEIKTRYLCNRGNRLWIAGNATGTNGSGLDVEYFDGAAWQSGIVLNNTSGGNPGDLLLLQSGGNVGIGTASPSALLDCNGDAIINGDLSVDGDISVDDNWRLTLGSSADLQIKHDGTNSSVTNWTGDLTIVNNANNKDIIFQSDDGSDGATTYLYLDGSVAAGGDLYTIFPDRSHASFGTSRDFDIHHDSGNTYLSNNTGHLNFRQQADDSDIIFDCDDGSGGRTEYMRIDGGDENIVASKDFVQTPAASVTPANNGELVVEATSNTSITFKLKGSDGTVRTGSLTLS